VQALLRFHLSLEEAGLFGRQLIDHTVDNVIIQFVTNSSMRFPKIQQLSKKIGLIAAAIEIHSQDSLSIHCVAIRFGINDHDKLVSKTNTFSIKQTVAPILLAARFLQIRDFPFEQGKIEMDFIN
jgi:hypothetical protein